jgi:hypothetical protein
VRGTDRASSRALHFWPRPLRSPRTRRSTSPARRPCSKRALTQRFGDVVALDRLTLAIPPGDVFCLLGASGAGKTTTINLFLGLLAPSEGHALVDGLDVAEHPLETKRRLAYIPETVMLYRNLTALENLDHFASLATGRAFGEDELRAHLAAVGAPRDLPPGNSDSRLVTRRSTFARWASRAYAARRGCGRALAGRVLSGGVYPACETALRGLLLLHRPPDA